MNIFQPCILIPVYNHGTTLAALLLRLQPYQLPIILIDDGSDAQTQVHIQSVVARYSAVTALRLATNSGKGAAVMHGLRAARDMGFSHALQIDADGQHDCADVPKFLALGAAQPLAAICGQPIFDDSVPKGRLYGRYITHFWVWVETLSFAIGDSMCGYRLYPLTSTCELIESVPIPKRMDFDTAIAVHLAWRGVRFINVPTRVIYPVGGLSHFKMWADNWRITKMHTRLVFGMLLRLPILLARKIAQ
jgi:glycosyltransferase involved in cell wall biosynthesis